MAATRDAECPLGREAAADELLNSTAETNDVLDVG